MDEKKLKKYMIYSFALIGLSYVALAFLYNKQLKGTVTK